MIQILQSYCTTDGQLFKNLSDCQEHALELLLKDKSAADQTIYQTMVQHADAVIAILGGKVEPKAKARKTRRDKGLPRKKDVTIAEIRGIMPQTSKPTPTAARKDVTIAEIRGIMPQTSKPFPVDAIT